MQVHVESSASTASRLTSPLPTRSLERKVLVRLLPAPSTLATLRQAQREAVQSHRFEQLVWISLSLASLALLFLSLYQSMGER